MKTFWGIVHHVIAHPLMAVLPRKQGYKFHDWTAKKAYGYNIED